MHIRVGVILGSHAKVYVSWVGGVVVVEFEEVYLGGGVVELYECVSGKEIMKMANMEVRKPLCVRVSFKVVGLLGWEVLWCDRVFVGMWWVVFGRGIVDGGLIGVEGGGSDIAAFVGIWGVCTRWCICGVCSK